MEFKKGDKVRVYDRLMVREAVIEYLNEEKQQASVLLDDGSKNTHGYSLKQLELIERPKQKVKLYKYAYKLKDVGRWDESLRFYNGDSEFTNCNPNYRTFKRLDSTMIEVDDE